MSPSPKGFRAADIVVIVTLWTLQIYDIWISSLYNHSSDVISSELKLSKFYQNAVLYILIGKCILACVLAAIVDAYNHKYAVVCGGMCLSMITPALALSMCITENRGLAVLTLCASSLLFVTTPAAFGEIFRQKKRPLRVQVRRLVSTMEFVQVMMLVISMELIPEGSSHSEQYSMIASWILVVPFTIFIITILERVRKYVRSEVLKERGVVAIVKGIRDDVSGKSPGTGLSKMNVLVFTLLLLPAFSLTFLRSLVSNLKYTDDTQFQHPSLKRIVVVAQLTAIPVTEVAVSYAPLKEIVAELLVLGLAHIFNVGVMTVLCARLIVKSRHTPVLNEQPNNDNHSISNVGSITDVEYAQSTFNNHADRSATIARDQRGLTPGKFQFYIVNHSSTEVNVSDPSGILFTGVKRLGKCREGFLELNNITIFGKVDLTISIWSTSKTQGSKLNQTVTFEEKILRYIGISGNESHLVVSLGGDDVSIPEFVDQANSIVVIQNTIIGNSYFGQVMKPQLQITLTTNTGTPLALVLLPHYSKSLTLVVPSSEPGTSHRFDIHYVGGDPLVKKKLQSFKVIRFPLEPLFIYAMSYGICEQRPQFWVFRTQIRTFWYKAETSPPTPAPFVPDKPGLVVKTTFAVIGAMLGMTTVGYIHFFWMGAPSRLRSTLYAWFIVTNELLAWIATHVIGHEVNLKEAITLLLITIATAIWHFVFGWYYERKVMTEAWLCGQN